MAYASINFPSKKALREAVASGRQISLQPGLFNDPTEGQAFVEGPWFPQPHRWYATVQLRDGVIVKVS